MQNHPLSRQEKILRHLTRYRSFFLLLAALLLLTAFQPDLGMEALGISGSNFAAMLLVLPPVYLILGLLDVWVPREAMMRYMGEGSGPLGTFLAFLVGSAAAGPLYGAFPVAAVFMKKGVSFFNIMVFLTAWSTTKIPMFLYETAALGLRFSLSRLLINIPGILIIAFAMNRLVGKKEKERIFREAEHL